MKNIFLFPTVSEVPRMWRKKKSWVLHPIPGKQEYYYAVTGMGIHAAAFVSQLDLSCEDRVIVAGCCGALAPELRLGDIIVTKGAYDETSRLPCDPSLVSQLTEKLQTLFPKAHIMVGDSYTSHTIVSIPTDKYQLWKTKKVPIVEMENYLVGKYLHERNIPWVSVRIVLDIQSSVLPSMGNTVSSQGEISIVQAILWCITHPKICWQLPNMMHAMKSVQDIQDSIWKNGGL